MIIGVDPGSVSAAYGVIDSEGQLIDVGDVPVVDKMVDASGWFNILDLLGAGPGDVAVVEQVSAMPKQGVSSSFRFGMGCGMLRGVIVARGIPLVQVTPAKWKKHFSLNTEAEKSRALALRKWPGCKDLARKKDHGRAEALLLAEYHRETRHV